MTSVCGKVMESIIRSELLHHCELYDLLSTRQHGFRDGRSCTTQLLTVVENWTQSLDNHMPVDCIYLDYRKAFDSVPHRRLLKKLSTFGIQGNTLKWLESFLVGRRQRVRVNSALSDWTEVRSGIPQGSVLGPLLFTLFINDLPSVATSTSDLFADDTKVHRPVSTQEDAKTLQDDIDAMHDWSTRWQLPFNDQKCKVVHYGRQNQKHSYKMNETVIAEDKQEKDLGITFDQNLTFSTHHDNTTAKARSRTGLIKRSFKHLPPKPFLQLYKSIV